MTPWYRPFAYQTFKRASPALTKGVVRFKIYPARYQPRDLRPKLLSFKLYWNVLIFPDLASLNAYASWRTGDASRCAGIVFPMGRHRVPAKRAKLRVKRAIAPKLGEVCFAQGRLSLAVIAHEAVHVASSTLRTLAAAELLWGLPATDYVNLGQEGIGDEEERLAYIAGHAVIAIDNGLRAAGFAQVARDAAHEGQYGLGGDPSTDPNADVRRRGKKR